MSKHNATDARHFLTMMKASEFLNQAWNKPKLKHRSPNLLKAINHFNDISSWIAHTILKVERIKERARIMIKVIRMAEVLLSFRLLIFIGVNCYHSMQ